MPLVVGGVLRRHLTCAFWALHGGGPSIVFSIQEAQWKPAPFCLFRLPAGGTLYVGEVATWEVTLPVLEFCILFCHGNACLFCWRLFSGCLLVLPTLQAETG